MVRSVNDWLRHACSLVCRWPA
jgi:hypothetical protein